MVSSRTRVFLTFYGQPSARSTFTTRPLTIVLLINWTKPSTTPSPSLAEGVFTVTHPFHPLYGQQFEILTYRHNWGEYRVTFYQTPDHVRALPATWTSIASPDPSVVLAAGCAAFRVADLLQLSQLIGRIEEERKEEAEC